MAKAWRPLGSFLEGYREAQQKQQQQQERSPSLMRPATDVLELFARKKVNSVLVFEIASELIITNQAAMTLANELANRKLVRVIHDQKGNAVVELTQRGKTYLEQE